MEPANPALYTELGRLYLMDFQTQKDIAVLARGTLEKAKDEFENAIRVKSDFLPALLERALIFEKEGELLRMEKDENGSRSKMAETRRTMEGIVEKIGQGILPVNTEAFFHLGRLYLNNNENEKAENQFIAVLVLNPNHSNALYSLGVVYQRTGEPTRAKELFERVLQLNPSSKEVLERLEELK